VNETEHTLELAVAYISSRPGGPAGVGSPAYQARKNNGFSGHLTVEVATKDG
jgi:hypothetical protein